MQVYVHLKFVCIGNRKEACMHQIWIRMFQNGSRWITMDDDDDDDDDS